MFAQQLVNGLMLGGAYALVAIGYTLIFGVLNLLHLAHGEVFMVGAYVGLALALAGFSPWVVLAGAMLAAATLGVLVERVAFRPVRNRGSHVTPLITTIAVSMVSLTALVLTITMVVVQGTLRRRLGQRDRLIQRDRSVTVG